MSLNRQKVDFSDPLSLFSSTGQDSDMSTAKDIEYVNEETNFRTVDLDKVQFGAGKKKKQDKVTPPPEEHSPVVSSLPSVGPRPITPPLREEPAVVPQASISETTIASSSITAAVPAKPAPKPIVDDDEDIFLVKKKVEVDEDEDIFNFKKDTITSSSNAKTSSKTNYAPKPITKIDFTKEDDDDVSDLSVTKLLEREEQLDFSLFGKVNTTTEKQKLAKKKMDLDQESDFLKQLDEITNSSSKKLSSSSSTGQSSLSSAGVTSKPTHSSAAASGDFDINSLNLDDYISQNASSGGGLFDD